MKTIEQLGKDDFDRHVRDILTSMKPGLTPQQFRERCRPDINAGSLREVDEAQKIYFKNANALKDRKKK